MSTAMTEMRPDQDPDDEGTPAYAPGHGLKQERGEIPEPRDAETAESPERVNGAPQMNAALGASGASRPGGPGPGNRAPRRPRSDSLPLGSLDGAVPSARLHARHVLWEWGLESLAPSVELVVSELVTNAVQATQRAELDSPVRLSLLADEGSVLVVVGDAVDDPPELRHPDATDEDGRGLVIVDSFTEWWDWKPARGGKLVRALVSAA